MNEQAKAQIGVTGLSVMGRNLARNLARHGFTVALHNRSPERTRSLIAEHGDEGTFVPSESMEDFVASLSRPRAVIVMVKAGAATDAVIAELVELLEPDDIVIDCGNTHFTDTIRREKDLAAKGLHFVGTGVSGGEEGALLGPSIMPGGSAQAYRTLGPIFESIAAQVEGTPCAVHVGPDGAGHFVKMVHNGIEYADMQLIAEAYDLLRSGLDAEPAQIAEIFREWNEGELESFLIEITADVLAHTDAATGRPFIDVVADRAEQKGTGRWTVQSALDLGVPITGIAEATFARSLSGHTEQRGPARRAFADAAVGADPPASSTIRSSSSRTSATPCTPRRSSPTRRASTTSRPAARSTAGTSTAARWPRSGAAAASSGPGSSIASARPTPTTRNSKASSSTPTSPAPSPRVRRAGDA
jgi:6-phosphogluconate dehydrogenase